MLSQAELPAQEHKRSIIFLLWFALGLVTSFPGLSRTLYYDEIFETRTALLPIEQQISPYFDSGQLQRTSPPFYHILLHPILMVFGVTPFTSRTVSWLAGAITVAAMYMFLQTVFARPWPILATLSFMLTSWHITIAQTARQHSLFVMFVLLSLLTWTHLGKARWRVVLYSFFLAAACHTYYWGTLVVLPCHTGATLLMRKKIGYWRRALLAQTIAALTVIPYVFPILKGYQILGVEETGWSLLTLPSFAGIFVLFSSANWTQIELVHLLWVGIVTLVVVVAITAGVLWWSKDERLVSHWLGVCFLGLCFLLFLAYVKGASSPTLAGPLIRRFAILQIPLLFFFLYGISRISQPTLRYGIFFVWAITTGVFGIRFMNSDFYKGSQLVAQHVAQLSPPVTTFLNFDTSLPAEQGSLKFLLERMQVSSGYEFHNFDFKSDNPEEVQIPESGTTCFTYMRESGYLQAQLREFMHPKMFADSADAKFNLKMQEISARFQTRGWKTVVSEYYPGRISFQLACFEKQISSAEAKYPARS